MNKVRFRFILCFTGGFLGGSRRFNVRALSTWGAPTIYQRTPGAASPAGGFSACPRRAVAQQQVPYVERGRVSSGRGEIGSLERPTSERCNVSRCQLEPFTVRSLLVETAMPVSLDTRRVVSPDRMHEFRLIGQRDPNLLHAPFEFVTATNLVEGTRLDQVHMAYVRCALPDYSLGRRFGEFRDQCSNVYILRCRECPFP